MVWGESLVGQCTPVAVTLIRTDDSIINNIESLIPNIIHFIFGLIPQNEEFNMYRYIAVKSAYDVNKPDKIYFYYFYEPYGYWWDKTKEIVETVKLDDKDIPIENNSPSVSIIS